MSRPAFDDIYMQLAEQVARRSHCVRVQVGAVLVKDKRVISVGYNGPPAGTINCDEESPLDKGCSLDERKQCSLGIHAEQNAILYAAKQRINLKGATLYTTLAPCMACAKVIHTMEVSHVLYQESYAAYKGIPADEGLQFLQRFGVTTTQYLPKSSSRST